MNRVEKRALKNIIESLAIQLLAIAFYFSECAKLRFRFLW